MRISKFALTTMALLLIFGNSRLHADDFDDTLISLNLGYRYDTFQIASHSDFFLPNTLRKQSWRDISIFTFGISASTYTQYNLFLRGKLEYGQVTHSSATFRTPLLDQFHVHRKKDPGGATYEGAIAVGFPIWLRLCDHFHFIPLFGYSYDRFKFKGRDDLSLFSDQIKSNAHNRVTIQGPMVGIDFFYTCCLWRLSGSYEFHWGHMRSHGDYHARSAFKYSVSDHARGFGNTAALGLACLFSTEWETSLTCRYRDWHANRGRHRTNFSFAADTERARSRLSGVNWQSWDAIIDLIMRY